MICEATSSTPLEGAYALRGDLMVSVGVPILFYRLRVDDALQAGRGLGDIRLSTRYRAVSRRVSASIGPFLSPHPG